MQSKPVIRALVLALAFALLGSALLGKLAWPIVPFDMYSRAQLGDFKVFVLEGVDDLGNPFPVSGTFYLAPYSDASAQSLFLGALHEGPGRVALILDALKLQYLRRWHYTGKHGPHLAGLRLYVNTFAFDRERWRMPAALLASRRLAETKP